VPELYDFVITGTIGPLIASCLPGLRTVAESECTVVTGSAAGPDDLRRVLDLLDAHAKPPLDIRIAHRR
jgi:hypothetical protein